MPALTVPTVTNFSITTSVDSCIFEAQVNADDFFRYKIPSDAFYSWALSTFETVIVKIFFPSIAPHMPPHRRPKSELFGLSWIIRQNALDWCARETEDVLANLDVAGVDFGHLYDERPISGRVQFDMQFETRQDGNGSLRYVLERFDSSKALDKLDREILCVLTRLPYTDSNYGLVQLVHGCLKKLGFHASLPTISRRLQRLKSGPRETGNDPRTTQEKTRRKTG